MEFDEEYYRKKEAKLNQMLSDMEKRQRRMLPANFDPTPFAYYGGDVPEYLASRQKSFREGVEMTFDAIADWAYELGKQDALKTIKEKNKNG